MSVRSKELMRIRVEIDDACDDVYCDCQRFRNEGDEESRMLARMAYSHLRSAYLTLLDAVELIEELEERE